MQQVKTLGFWEHLAMLAFSQAPMVAAAVLGASNPVTVILGAAGIIGHSVYALCHAKVNAAMALNAAASTASTLAGVNYGQPALSSAAQAAQAVADSLSKIVAALPSPATPAPAPAKPAGQ
ncbi:MAG: hypothetical protein KGO96_13740 [Elusimicrobia bacterium]|nr:hypothetical protein [Elusimicrobiota bacterium]MDE2236249.1 hypothetical protein [Elusimicrobiota bacterium]MDE2426957.1 hypothetical protein [Elusimicrobiota bacterium]